MMHMSLQYLGALGRYLLCVMLLADLYYGDLLSIFLSSISCLMEDGGI